MKSIYDIEIPKISNDINIPMDFLISDIEVLGNWNKNSNLKKGYFMFQWLRYASKDKAKYLECVTDSEFRAFYKRLNKNKLPLYFYSINYDFTILNSILKLVEANETNIGLKIKQISDCLVAKNSPIIYKFQNFEFWRIFREECNNDYEATLEKFLSKQNDERVVKFYTHFHRILGRSKVLKNTILIEIPKLLRFYNIRKDGICRPSVSLKNLQLIDENTNLLWDFEDNYNIQDIKNRGVYDDFVGYGLNDVNYLKRCFEKRGMSILNKRKYSIELLLKYNKNFQWSENMIHSETDTNLIVGAFGLENPKYPTIKYTDYIKPTGFKVFDELVKFIDEHQNIKKDVELKEEYCKFLNKEFVLDDEDYKQIEIDGTVEKIVTNFETFDLFGCLCKIGFGGKMYASN